MGILVSFHFYNKLPQFEWLVNKIKLFLTVLETSKSKIKALADLASEENLLPSSEMVISPCPLKAPRELFAASFIRALFLS